MFGAMDVPATRLGPPPTKGHLSVVKLERAWFIACAAGELGARPLARVVQGVPLVLFRGAGGKPAALLDRCPHRNAPLSAGAVRLGELECRYHGWRFDGGGRCTAVPGLCGEPEGKARRAPAHACVEQDGFVWVYATADVEPHAPPFRFPHLDDRRYSTVVKAFDVPSTLHAALENTLDVPHTAFLHGGLFRTAHKEHRIEVVVRRGADRVEAEFLGEPRPKGLAGRLLAPGGGVVVHFDRFLLPSIAQVEYRLGDENHLVVTSAMTPISDFETRLWAVTTFRLRIPHFLVKPFLTPVATRIFRQDAEILAAQAGVIRRFGGEQYASTEIDVLGPEIWRLLLQAERGDAPPEGAAHEQRLEMLV